MLIRYNLILFETVVSICNKIEIEILFFHLCMYVIYNNFIFDILLVLWSGIKELLFRLLLLLLNQTVVNHLDVQK